MKPNIYLFVQLFSFTDKLPQKAANSPISHLTFRLLFIYFI